MRKKSKLRNIIFLALGFLFLAYGVFAVINAINYVSTYTTSATTTTSGMIQYIITSSMAYFGFGILFIAISMIFDKLDNLDKIENLSTSADLKSSETESKPAKVKETTHPPIQEEVAVQIPTEVKAEAVQAPAEEKPVEAINVPTEEVATEDIPVQIDEETGKPEFEVEYLYEEAQPEPEAKAEPEVQPEPEVKVEPEVQPEPEIEAKPAVQPELEAKAETDIDSDFDEIKQLLKEICS